MLKITLTTISLNPDQILKIQSDGLSFIDVTQSSPLFSKEKGHRLEVSDSSRNNMQLVSSQREIAMAITEKLSRKTGGENISPTCYHTIHRIESFVSNKFFFQRVVFLSHKLAKPKNGLKFL